MSYETIDPIITAWASKHTLQIYTTSRDVEVRSIDFLNPSGRKCQLWIDPPDPQGIVQVHVWDYNRWRQDSKATILDLSRCLEQAYETAMKAVDESSAPGK